MIIWQLYSRNHFKAGWGLRNHDCVLCLMMSFNLCLMFVCLMHFQFLSCIWWMFLLFFFFVQAHWACRMGSEHRLWCEYFGHCMFVFNAKHSDVMFSVTCMSSWDAVVYTISSWIRGHGGIWFTNASHLLHNVIGGGVSS